MNPSTTAVLYCFECQRVRPKDEMEFVSPNKKRKACAQCRERINRCRKEITERQAVLRAE